MEQNEKTVWISAQAWESCVHDLKPEQVAAKFKRFGGTAGANFESLRGIGAFVMISNPDENGDRYVVPFFYAPSVAIYNKDLYPDFLYLKRNFSDYIKFFAGKLLDFNCIAPSIFGACMHNNITRVEIDPLHATGLINTLSLRGLNAVEIPQHIAMLSYPTKQFEALVHNGKLKHDGDPILAWMVLHSYPKYNTIGDYCIIHNPYPVMGVKALINAFAGSLANESQPAEKRNLLQRIKNYVKKLRATQNP